MEELVGGARLALEELDVVDQEDVGATVMPLELLDPGALEGGDELVGEALGGRVVDGQLGIVVVEVVGDRPEQVGLAQSGGTVEKERVVGLPGGLGHRQGGGVGELAAGADDEALEGVGGIEGDAGRPPRKSSADSTGRLRPQR